MIQVQQNGSEEEGERNRDSNHERAAHVSEKQEEDQRNQEHAVREVSQNRVAGVFDEVAAIQMRYKFHSGGQETMVELVDFLVQSGECRLGFGSFAEQDDTLHHIFIVDDSTVFMTDGLPQLSQPHFRSLHHGPEVADSNRSAVRYLDHGGRNVIGGLH